MSIKVGINGFGRIGRSTFKAMFENPEIEIVAINDLTDTKTLAHLLRHDTSYGHYHNNVDYTENSLIVKGKSIKVMAQKDPLQLGWGDLGVEIVIESTGRFADAESAGAHITAGAKRVIVSAPFKGDGGDIFVLGVNDEKYTGQEVISMASCTTNCIAPITQVMIEKFGVEKAIMSTVHGYTNDQNLHDAPHKDLRRARAAAENIIPTTTGAAKATGSILPEVHGLFDGHAIRVPVLTVSLSDIVYLTSRDVTPEEVNTAMIEAAASERYKGILGVTEEELVSSDFKANSHSSVVDLLMTRVVGGNLVKIIAWYDNEFGYSLRLSEMVLVVAKTI